MLQLRSAERGIADKWFLMMEGAALGLKERSLGALETLTAETQQITLRFYTAPKFKFNNAKLHAQHCRGYKTRAFTIC